MVIAPIKTRVFKAGEDLADFIIEHIQKPQEKSILVITSKIAALAENRVVPYESQEQKVELMKKEATDVIRTQYTWLTMKDGMLISSAGIDESNADGHLVLLPTDSFKVAYDIREKLKQHFGLKDFGTIVTDSRIMPLRKGTLGAAYGYAGFKALKSYVGEEDIFGRRLKREKMNIPDALASAAVVTMGEGAEQQPLAMISEFDAEFSDEKADKNELVVPIEDDKYGPMYLHKLVHID